DWERLLPLVDPDGPVHEQLQASLAQARRAAGLAASGAAGAAFPPAPPIVGAGGRGERD
ncbi:cytochrome C biogenesis protein, partial [Achromobacter xylosoxidans]